MAKTILVGRVSVKVRPDTSTFRKELQAEVEKASKNVKAEVGVRLASINEIRRELVQRIREVNASIKGDDRYALRTTAKADFDCHGLRRQIERCREAIEAENRANPLELHTKVDRDDLHEYLQYIKDVKVDVKIDVDKLALAAAAAPRPGMPR